MSASVQPGSRVCVNFTLSLEDDTLVDASEPGAPWCFTLGSGALVEGMEKVIMEMTPGDRQRVTLGPEEAFGTKDMQAIHFLPREDFPVDMELEPGAVVGFALPSGDEIPGVVVEVLDEQVLVDLNHPLAGHTLFFDVEVVSVEPS